LGGGDGIAKCSLKKDDQEVKTFLVSEETYRTEVGIREKGTEVAFMRMKNGYSMFVLSGDNDLSRGTPANQRAKGVRT